MANFFRALRLSVGAVVLTLAPLTPVAAEPPPLEAYGSLPDIEQMALSESGDRLAAVMTLGGRRTLIVMTSALDPLNAIPLGEEKVRDLEWVGDEKLVAVISQTSTLPPEYINSQFEFVHAIILPASPSNERKVVFDGDATMMNAVFGSYGVRKVDGKWMAYFGGVEKDRGVRDYYISNGSPALYAVDVTENNWRRVADRASPGMGQQWLLGTNGRIAATISFEPVSGKWN
jgi:hypothetical protein